MLRHSPFWSLCMSLVLRRNWPFQCVISLHCLCWFPLLSSIHKRLGGCHVRLTVASGEAINTNSWFEKETRLSPTRDKNKHCQYKCFFISVQLTQGVTVGAHNSIIYILIFTVVEVVSSVRRHKKCVFGHVHLCTDNVVKRCFWYLDWLLSLDSYIHCLHPWRGDWEAFQAFPSNMAMIKYLGIWMIEELNCFPQH